MTAGARETPSGRTTQLYVRDLGPRDAPAVLLLHGQMLDGRIYDALATRLAARFRVLVPDLPGYGGSRLPAPYTLDAVHDSLREMLESRCTGATAVVGYSLGSYHALALALEGAPFTRIALIGALAGLDAPAREAFRGYAAAVRGGARVGALFAQMAIPPAVAAARPELALEVAAAADEVDPATYVAELEAIAELPDLRPRLEEIRAPVLLRVGALDRNTPPQLSEEMCAQIPGALLEVVPGVGHLYLQQDPEGTEASVEHFLLA